MPANLESKIVWLDGQILAREDWLDTHGHKVKWSEADLEAKRKGLDMLQEIREDYAKSLERSKASNDQS